MVRPEAPKSSPYTWTGPPRTVEAAEIAMVRSVVDLPEPPVP